MTKFFTSIALSGSIYVTPDEVKADLPKVCGSAPLDVEISSASLETAPKGFMLSVNGIEVVVLPMADPLPPEAYEFAARTSILWPEAQSSLSASRAHITVAALREAKGHAEALAAAFAVTVVTASVIRRAQSIGLVRAMADQDDPFGFTPLVRSLGVVFNPALTALPAKDAISMASNLAQKREIPDVLWVSVNFVPGQKTAAGEETIGLGTRGLAAFVGREIEFLPVAWPPAELARRTLGLAQYLILKGPVIADGDTVGDTPAERIHVQFRDKGQWINGPVMALSAAGSAQ